MATYYGLEPQEGRYLHPEAILKIIIQNFKNYFLDEETAKKETAQRLVFLKEINAEQSLIDLYENSQPIKCTIFNEDKTNHIEFNLDKNQGILIFPDFDTIETNGMTETVKILAEKTGYKLTVEEE